ALPFPVEQHASGKAFGRVLRDGVGGLHPVDLAALTAGGGDRVVPGAVVGDQYQAGGVDVEAAGDLQALLVGFVQQVEDRGVLAVLGGADVAGGLVEHEVAGAGGDNGHGVEGDPLPGMDVLAGIAGGDAVDVDASVPQ